MATLGPLVHRLLSCRDVRFRTTRILVAASSVLAVSLPPSAIAQTTTICGPEVKEGVVLALAAAAGASDADKLVLEKGLYAKYQYCAQEAQLAPASFFAAARECGASARTSAASSTSK